MGKTEGYVNYVCDRNGFHFATIKRDSPEEDNWHYVERIRKDGTRISRWLCDACYEEYQTLLERHDGEFDAFMAGGSVVENGE